MKRFRIRNGVAAIIIISMVIVAGCGKGTSSSTDDVKPDKDTTAVEENDTKDDIQAEIPEAEIPENDDTAGEDTAEGSEEGTEKDTADQEVADSSEMNEYGIPEDLMQELYDCVEEAVLTGYIEPNGIDPAEFQWPGDDRETHVFAWSYLVDMYSSYLDSGSMYDISNLSFQKPDDATCQLMESVLDGIVKWESSVPERIYKINVMHSPIDKLFPENIDFTD